MTAAEVLSGSRAWAVECCRAEAMCDALPAKAADPARARRKRALGLLDQMRAEGLVRLGGDGLWRRV